MTTNTARTIAPITEENGVLMIYQSTDSSVAVENYYVFKDYYSLYDSGYIIGRAVDFEGLDNVGFIGVKSQTWSELFERGLDNASRDFGFDIVRKEYYDIGVDTHKTNILKMKNDGIDAIVFLGIEPDQIKFFKAVNELKCEGRVFVIEGLHENINNDINAKLGMNLTKPIATWFNFDPNDDDLRVKDFTNRHFQRYGFYPKPDAAFYYDEVLFLKGVFEECHHNFHAKCFRDEILSSLSFEGIAGDIYFDGKKYNDRELVLFEYDNGNWEEYSLN